MRSKVLAAKRAEIQKALEEWASKSDILKPGERIAFSLNVENQPTVVDASTAEYLSMAPEQFFSKERLMAFGVPRRRAAMISHYVDYANHDRYPNRHVKFDETLSQWLARYPTKEKIRKIRQMGRHCVEDIVSVLHQTNLAHL